MRNSSGGEILLKEAKRKAAKILRLVSEYNEIADALVRLGYVLPDGFGRGDYRPFPTMEISGGGFRITDQSFVDEFAEAGPKRLTTSMCRALGLEESLAPPSIRRPMASFRLALGAESDWTCFYCRKQGTPNEGPDGRTWHVDHKHPVCRGGDNDPENLALACASCNLEKKDRTADEFLSAKQS